MVKYYITNCTLVKGFVMSQTYTSNDFNDIMNSLVLFMKSQNEFKDMNFDGSAIRELLRVLAFNAQQQAFQNNFVFNELQLDSAQLRQNVVSIVSRLGYVPSSKTAARIKVNLVVKPSDPESAPNSLVLNRDVQFYANKDGQMFIFTPEVEYTANKVSGVYTFSGVNLRQGIWTLNGFVVSSSRGAESYIIPNSSVDINTLEVAVRTSESSGDQELYQQFKTAYDLSPESKLFFIRENRQSLYEFKFGDGKFAKKLSYGNIITARYLVTQGVDGNDITSLSPASSIGGFYDINIEYVDARSYGGSDQESIESIRTLAPIVFSSSDNAVTSGDYVGLTKKLFPEVQDVICWGGEESNPPKYGYVYLSIIPKNGMYPTDSQKADLLLGLKKFNVATVTPLIVNPEYTFINVNTVVRYSPSVLTISTTLLQNKIKDYCRSYSREKLEIFGGVLEMSSLSRFIDNIDVAIKGNYTYVSYEKRFVPTLNEGHYYSFDFSHKLAPGSINVSGFRISDVDYEGKQFVVYDDYGVLKLKKIDEEGNMISMVSDYVGKVNYESGLVELIGFKPSFIDNGSYVKVVGSCSSIEDQSMISTRNSIMKFNDIDITLRAAYK